MQILMVSFVFAQVRTVTGKVTDSKGNPASFVTVSLRALKRLYLLMKMGFFLLKPKQEMYWLLVV